MIEDGWIRSETSNRKFSNIAQQRTAGEQAMCDVIEPDALTNSMQFLGRSIHFIPLGKHVTLVLVGFQVHSLYRLCAGGESHR
jgi:hypothetical protein